MRKIYFNLEGNEFKTVEELLNFGFSEPYWASTCGLFKPTYKNEGLTSYDCRASKRSFLDLWHIVNTYFPNIGKMELAYILLNNLKNLDCYFCCSIDEHVFFKRTHTKGGCNFSTDWGGSKASIGTASRISFKRLEFWSERYKNFQTRKSIKK